MNGSIFVDICAEQLFTHIYYSALTESFLACALASHAHIPHAPSFIDLFRKPFRDLNLKKYLPSARFEPRTSQAGSRD